MAQPRLLMLDEPSFGSAPILVAQTFEMVKRIKSEGVAILLVERNVRAALELVDRAYLLENGRVAGQGSGKDLLAFESVCSVHPDQGSEERHRCRKSSRKPWSSASWWAR